MVVYPYLGIDLTQLKEQMSYAPIIFQEPSRKSMPLKWWEAHPVVGSQLISLIFEPTSETQLNLVITGNTWVFRASTLYVF